MSEAVTDCTAKFIPNFGYTAALCRTRRKLNCEYGFSRNTCAGGEYLNFLPNLENCVQPVGSGRPGEARAAGQGQGETCNVSRVCIADVASFALTPSGRPRDGFARDTIRSRAQFTSVRPPGLVQHESCGGCCAAELSGLGFFALLPADQPVNIGVFRSCFRTMANTSSCALGRVPNGHR